MKKRYVLITFSKSLCLLVLYLLNVNSGIHGQDMPGESFTITSKYMESERKIQVVLPRDYNETDSYNVYYVLDPEGNIKHRKLMLGFLNDNWMAPKTILVGIVSPDRNSDMLPSKSSYAPTGGNADNFINFITKEVKPFIEKKYKTSGFNTLDGHSFGGLFVMYSMLQNPEGFDAYLIGDPAFWYDNNLVINMAKEKLPTLKNLGKVVFIGGREDESYKTMGISAMEKVLEGFAPEDLDWKIVAYPDENHISVIFKLYYDGVKFVSQDYRNNLIKAIPESGEVVPGLPLTVFLESNSNEVKYTMDGSEPDLESATFKDSVSISNPGILKIKIPLKRKNLLPAREGIFVAGKKIKGIKKGKNMVPGLNYEYYEGEWNKLPDFKTLKPVKKGNFLSGIELASLPKKDNFGCVIKGYFEATESGYHYFALSSDDGLKFYIHDKLMIDNDGRHDSNNIRTTVLYLEKGLHPVAYEYFEAMGGEGINLYAKFPGDKKPGILDFKRFWSIPND